MKASYKFIDQEYTIFKYAGIDWQKYVTFDEMMMMMMISYLRQMLTLTFNVYTVTLKQQSTRASLSRRKNILTANQSISDLYNSLIA